MPAGLIAMTAVIPTKILVKAYCFYLFGSLSATAIGWLFLMRYANPASSVSAELQACGCFSMMAMPGLFSIWLFGAITNSLLSKLSLTRLSCLRMFRVWCWFRMWTIFYSVSTCLIGSWVFYSFFHTVDPQNYEYLYSNGFSLWSCLAAVIVSECAAFVQVDRNATPEEHLWFLPPFLQRKAEQRIQAMEALESDSMVAVEHEVACSSAWAEESVATSLSIPVAELEPMILSTVTLEDRV